MPRKLIWCIQLPNEPWIVSNFSMTHVLFYVACRKQSSRREEAVIIVSPTRGACFPTGTRRVATGSGLSKGCNIALPKLDSYVYHVVTPCQVSWFPGEFWIYRHLKTKIRNVCGQARTARRLNSFSFVPWDLNMHPKETCTFFLAILVHWSMYL